VHHVGILYDQFMMHGQRNIKLYTHSLIMTDTTTSQNIDLFPPNQATHTHSPISTNCATNSPATTFHSSTYISDQRLKPPSRYIRYFLGYFTGSRRRWTAERKERRLI